MEIHTISWKSMQNFRIPYPKPYFPYNSIPLLSLEVLFSFSSLLVLLLISLFSSLYVGTLTWETKNEIFLVSSSFYTLYSLLLLIGPPFIFYLEIKFLLFHFNLSSSCHMTFISYFENLQVCPCTLYQFPSFEIYSLSKLIITKTSNYAHKIP